MQLAGSDRERRLKVMYRGMVGGRLGRWRWKLRLLALLFYSILSIIIRRIVNLYLSISSDTRHEALNNFDFAMEKLSL